ncbi:hypothetical protein QFZ23_001315 [Arthrobacter globiformis]|uniref:hypothetical protein n=1 Tax=Arthrobacter globiformis TaxID=1665 RepID=UPI0027855C2E|nr:hypothetical protein [Arthrobacter globiformis]MDQ1057414.1 hypothetical protein [Arthrobacter globiformis]
MPSPRTASREVCSFTSKQWSGRPADGAGSMFGGFSVIGFVLCLLLMTFTPALRDVGATMLFVAAFATAFTILAILGKNSSERAFLQGLTGTVNDVMLELTADRTNQLSPDGLRSLLVEGGSLPLLVSGVSGLHLKAVPQPSPKPQQNAKPKTDVVTTTRIVIAATPPDYGIRSFDRLLETATTDPGFNSAAS